MKIRVMTIDDYEQVYSLWMNTPNIGLNNLDDSKDGIAKFLSRNPNTCFVADENSAIVGAILGSHDGRRGTIAHAAVAQNKQRLGIGKMLVNAVVSALKDEGINKIFITVFCDNAAGSNFWDKQGFSVREDLIYRDKELNPLIKYNSYKC